jgi:hypothetical protein
MTWSPLSCVRSRRAQPLGGPFGLGALRAPVFVLQVAQPGAQSAANGASSGAGHQGVSRPSPRMMAAHAVDPAAPAELRHHHGDQRDHQAQAA